MDSTVKKILDTIYNSHLATGVDISKYNVSADFDSAEYAEVLALLDFVMVRISSGRGDGTVYVDPLADDFYAELEQHPSIVRAAYHYFSSHSTWEKQYGYFMQGLEGKNFEILTLDFETAYNTRSQSFAKNALAFLNQLKQDFPTKRVVIYANKYTYRDWAQFYYDFGGFAYHHAQYPWVKWYDVGVDALLDSLGRLFSGETSPNLPPSRVPDKYALWQVGADTGIGKELGFGADYLDVNISRLPLDDFREWSGIANRWQPSEPPEVGTLLFKAKCIVGALNVRSGPGVSNAIVDMLKEGDIVDVWGVSDNNWFNIGGGHWCCGLPQYMEKLENVPEPPDAPLRMKVLSGFARINQSPSSYSPVVGLLSKDDVIVVKDVAGGDSWIKIDNGKWVCVEYLGTRYLEKV